MRTRKRKRNTTKELFRSVTPSANIRLTNGREKNSGKKYIFEIKQNQMNESNIFFSFFYCLLNKPFIKKKHNDKSYNHAAV